MKFTGIVRKVDQLGRLVLPKEIRQKFKIDIGDPVEIYVEEDKIILRKYRNVCCICNSTEDLIECNEMFVCKNCIKDLNRSAIDEQTPDAVIDYLLPDQE